MGMTPQRRKKLEALRDCPNASQSEKDLCEKLLREDKKEIPRGFGFAEPEYTRFDGGWARTSFSRFSGVTSTTANINPNIFGGGVADQQYKAAQAQINAILQQMADQIERDMNKALEDMLSQSIFPGGV